ncbi:MAG: leucine-rich repeat domain-containing protein [Muribaculaceae bacterium]|nr:leucine-rich repeat domain-containing protein [Muribaculaceae bacterium]
MIKRRMWEYFICLAVLFTVTQSALGEVPAYLEFGILSEEESTAEVAFKKYYKGDVDKNTIIPSTVCIDGKDYSVTTVKHSGFFCNELIDTITLPPTLKYINRDAFEGSNISEIIIQADRLEDLGDWSFSHCKNLKSFDLNKLPLDISNIGEFSFNGAGIEEAVWPEYMPVIPRRMFAGCNLRKISLPPTLESMEWEALSFTKLDTINIPANVKLGLYSLADLFELKEINLGEGCTLNAALQEAFYLEKLYLPPGTIIDGSNFTNLISLREVEIAEDVQFVGDPFLFHIDDPGDALDPNYVINRAYEDYPDWYDYLGSLPIFHEVEKIVYHTSTPQYIKGHYVFRNTMYDNTILYVNADGIGAAYGTNPWSRFKTILPIPGTEKMPEYLEFGIISEEEATVEVAFKSEYSGNVDDDIYIPSTVTISGKEYTVTAVKDGGFSGSKLNRDIQTITLGPGIKRIGESAFSGSSIKYLVVTADRLDEIGNNAFRNCVNLKKFTMAKLPTDITKIGTAVFYNTGLEEIEWPEDVTTIPEDFFRYSKPKDITLPDNVTIKSHALSDLYNLKALKIGNECTLENESVGNLFKIKHLILPDGTKIYGTNFSNSLSLEELRLGEIIEFHDHPRMLENVPLEVDESEVSLPEGFINGAIPPGQCGLWRIVYRCKTMPVTESPTLFREDIYDTAELYLPYSWIEPSRAISPWNQFGKIKYIDWAEEIPEYMEFEIYEDKILTAEVYLGNTDSVERDLIIPAVVRINGKTLEWEVSGGGDTDYNVVGVSAGGFRGSEGTKGLKSVAFPSSIDYVTIEREAFSGSSVEAILFKRQLGYIGDRAFEKCKNLLTIDLEKFPSRPTSWGSKLFYKSALKDVTWPKDKSTVPKEVFFGCEINTISFPETLRSVEKSAFQYAKIDSLAIPDNVAIQESAFSDIFNLKDLKLGTNCSIEVTAFNNAFSMTKLLLPAGTIIYGNKGFNNWLSIKEFEIAEDVQFTRNLQLFSNVSLTDKYEAWDDYPDGYTYGQTPSQIAVPEKVIYHTSTPQPLANMNFLPQSFYDNAILYVNADGVEKAKKTLPWNQFKTILPITPNSMDSVMEEKTDIDECPEGIYTIDGIYAGTTTEGLSPGIYVHRQGSRAKKIVIR